MRTRDLKSRGRHDVGQGHGEQPHPCLTPGRVHSDQARPKHLHAAQGNLWHSTHTWSAELDPPWGGRPNELQALKSPWGAGQVTEGRASRKIKAYSLKDHFHLRDSVTLKSSSLKIFVVVAFCFASMYSEAGCRWLWKIKLTLISHLSRA